MIFFRWIDPVVRKVLTVTHERDGRGHSRSQTASLCNDARPRDWWAERAFTPGTNPTLACALGRPRRPRSTLWAAGHGVAKKGQISQKKGCEIQHPLHREIEKLFVLPDSAREIEKSTAAAGLEPATSLTSSVSFSLLSHPTQLTSTRQVSVWLSIYSFCTCVKMFALTLYTASENCWYLPKWRKVAKNECVSDRKYIEHYFDTQQNGDVWWCFFRE